ncbi:MAG: hypothetical protein AAF683_04615 [Pseudomonadota bacterium]
MILFRILVAALLTTLLIYTGLLLADRGFDGIETFFSDIFAMNWQGQFNLDFFGFLILGTAWMLWRNNFKPWALAISPLFLFGGIPVITTYLLILSVQPMANMNRILLGPSRAR